MAFQILITATVSAIVTALLGGAMYWLFVRPALDKRLAQAANEIELRVQRGVEAAGKEMLPEFRKQVRDGFLEAVAQWPSSEFRNVTRSGAEFVEDGLNSLLGRRRKE